jgi:hypothetical protein
METWTNCLSSLPACKLPVRDREIAWSGRYKFTTMFGCSPRVLPDAMQQPGNVWLIKLPVAALVTRLKLCEINRVQVSKYVNFLNKIRTATKK